MKLLIALFKYFHWGGLQKDTLRFAQEAASRGHQVTILTTEWLGDRPDENILVEVVPIRAVTNHTAMDKFARVFREYLYRQAFDASLAMNRIPGADFYFVADSCMANWMPRKHSMFVLKCIPRYRTYLRHERSICAPLGPTRLMYIAAPQKADFMSAYSLPESRFLYLPPGMDQRCLRPENAELLRQQKRLELQLSANVIMLIEVGTNLWRKGVDRVLAAIAALPDVLRQRVRFFLAGNDDSEKLQKMAQTYDLEEVVIFLGPRDDVPELLLAADLMVHPAREEGTGTVLIEGLAAGLPVICTEVCGFSSFVHNATRTVVAEPFLQQNLNLLLQKTLAQLPSLAEQTIAYAQTQDFCGRNKVAIDAMEELAALKNDLDVMALYNYRPSDKLIHSRDFTGVDNGFVTMSSQDGHWTFLAKFPLEKLQQILVLHRQSCAAGEWLQNTSKRRVTRVQLQNQSFVIKEFYPDYCWQYFNHGRRTWENSQRLRGYSAPCLAWHRDQDNRSVLIFADLGGLGLRHKPHLQHENLPEIYGAVGHLLASLHNEGVYHADCKSTNFIINDLCPWLNRSVLLIDCDDVRFYSVLPLPRRIKNLAQFIATTGCIPEKKRPALIALFLTEYRRTTQFSQDAFAALLEKVMAMLDSGKIAETNCPSAMTYKYD